MSAAAGRSVTFLFTDIEGSTRRWEEDPDSMRGALAEPSARPETQSVDHSIVSPVRPVHQLRGFVDARPSL